MYTSRNPDTSHIQTKILDVKIDGDKLKLKHKSEATMRRVFVNDNDLLRPHPRCRTAHRAGVRTEVRQLQGIRSALQTHDESSRVWQLMISNQCPLCSTALVPRHQAARQARAPVQKNRCITDRTEWTHPIQDPPSMACTLCGLHCSHLAQFHRHAEALLQRSVGR